MFNAAGDMMGFPDAEVRGIRKGVAQLAAVGFATSVAPQKANRPAPVLGSPVVGS